MNRDSNLWAWCKIRRKTFNCRNKGYIVAEAPWWKTTYYEIHYENPEDVEKYSERFWGWT